MRLKINSILSHLTYHLVSISSTLCTQIFHTNVISAAFSMYVLVTRKKLPKWLLYKKFARITLMKLIAGIKILEIYDTDWWLCQIRPLDCWTNATKTTKEFVFKTLTLFRHLEHSLFLYLSLWIKLIEKGIQKKPINDKVVKNQWKICIFLLKLCLNSKPKKC